MQKPKIKNRIVELPRCGNGFLNFPFSYLIFYSILLHTDCFGWAGIDADTAVDAGIGVNLRLLINHLDSLARALVHTRFATSTFFLIYFSSHPYDPFKKTTIQNLPR